MQLAKTVKRGFSLLEVGLAFLLIGLIGGILILLFARLFGLSRTSDQKLYASTQLDGVAQIFRLRAKQNWPSSVSVNDVPIEEFVYDVEDLGTGRVPGPPVAQERPWTEMVGRSFFDAPRCLAPICL